MTTINSSNEIREIVGGAGAGTIVSGQSTLKEVLSGDRVGQSAPLNVVSQVRDVLTGRTVGVLITAVTVLRDALTGNSVGIDIKPQLATIVREVIGRDSSYKLETVTREVLAYAPNDLLTIAWSTQILRQAVTQRRAAIRPPAVVWSDLRTFVYRELVAQRNKRVRPISVESAMTLRAQVAQHRVTTRPASVLSTMRYQAARQLVVKSRLIPYVPVSGIFAYGDQQQVVLARPGLPAPAATRSPLAVAKGAALVVQSRRAGYLLIAAGVHELVLKQRPIPTFSAPSSLAGQVALVTQQRQVPGAIASTTSAAVETQLVAQRRETAGITRSDTTLFQQQALVVQAHPGAAPRSNTKLFQQRELVVQDRAPIRYYSDVLAGQQQALVVQHRVPGALPYTGESAITITSLTAQFRATVPPSLVGDWNVRTNVVQAVQRRTTPGLVRGMVIVGQQRVLYTLGMQYPLPRDVLGPELGAQVAKQGMLAVQKRFADTPDSLSLKSRFVRQVGMQVMAHAGFEDKNVSYNNAITYSLMQHALVGGEAWPSKDKAISDLDAFTVASAITVSDTFPDPLLAFSDARVGQIHQVAALGDQFPDPLVPLSDAQVFSLTEIAALGDAQFADPSIAMSDVSSWNVGAICAVHDADLVGNFTASEVSTSLIAEMFMLRDSSLVGIMRRRAPRPVVNVSMS